MTVPWMQVPVVVRKGDDCSTDDYGYVLYLGVGKMQGPCINLIVPKQHTWLDTGPARALAAALVAACDLIDRRGEKPA